MRTDRPPSPPPPRRPEAFGYSCLPARPAVELEVVLPVHNQAAGLRHTLAACTEYLGRQPFSGAVVVVDTGSCDPSPDVAADWPAGPVPVHLLGCSRRQQGAALLEGLATSRARFAGWLPVGMAPPVRILDFVVPHLWRGSRVVAGARPGVARRRRRLPGGGSRAEGGFGFFHLPTALPLLSACRARGVSFDTGAVALARRAGLPATEV